MSGVRGRRKARAPTISGKLKQAEQEQAFRKSLTILQPAADNPDFLVGCCGTPTSRKIENLNPTSEAKENSPMKPRRSKRKATVSSSEEYKVKSSTPISNDTKSAENSNLKQQTLTKYSKKLTAKLKEADPVIQEDKKVILEHPEASFSGISIRSESSGYCSADGLEKSGTSTGSKSTIEEAVDDANSSKKDVSTSLSEELQNTQSIPQEVYDLLISDKVPDSYWKELAEQRRLALEETLHENELLRDQLVELEAENSRLNSLLNDAEKLAGIVQDILEDP